MIIDTQLRDDGLAVLTLSGALVRASAVQELQRCVDHVLAQGRRGLLVNLARVGRINMSGLAALVELAARCGSLDLALCALPPGPTRQLQNAGLDRGLMLFDSVTSALSHPRLRGHRLTRTRAVVLCAGRGSRMAPLTDHVPKPMLDLLGRPVLHHILQHLGRFGLRDIVLNPGYLGEQVIDYFRPGAGPSPLPDTHLFFLNEGRRDAQGIWRASPLGSASTLRRLHVDHKAFGTDLVVMCGDALTDIDLGAMMQRHRDSGAMATLATQMVPMDQTHKYGIVTTRPGGGVRQFVEKPVPGSCNSRLANSGIYIFRSEVLDLLPDTEGLDIAQDLLPAILDQGGRIQTYQELFSWVDIGCGRDYVCAVQAGLAGHLPNVTPVGTQVRPGIWQAPGARVAPGARIDGPCYVGPGARIDRGATLRGPCALGAGSHVADRGYLDSCVTLPETAVLPGAWARNMILQADWAVDHTLATSPAPRRPLDNIGSARAIATHLSDDLLKHRA